MSWEDKILKASMLYYTILGTVEMCWLCFDTLSIRQKILTIIISPLVWPFWICWQLELHQDHKRMVREGKAKREWFKGILW